MMSLIIVAVDAFDGTTEHCYSWVTNYTQPGELTVDFHLESITLLLTLTDWISFDLVNKLFTTKWNRIDFIEELAGYNRTSN